METTMTGILSRSINPATAVYLELLALQQRPDLQLENTLGTRDLTPEEKAENAARREKRKRLRLEIIAKHGMVEHYLKPLLERRERLEIELKNLDQAIADLEGVDPNRQQSLL